MSDRVFDTWVFNSVRFLAVPDGNGGYHIVDQRGNNYGSWQLLEMFRSLQRAGESKANAIGGRATLRVSVELVTN